MFQLNLHASRTRFIVLVIACALTAAYGCARKKHRAHFPRSPRINAEETGIASWYGYPYHGRRAANGEIYDMEKLTAAHRTLAFDTWVDVLNLDNGRTVTVRITDRGPFIEGRIIDLSKAAAREIAMLGPGIANVRIKIVSPPPAPPSATKAEPSPEQSVAGRYAVQIGAFQDKSRAESVRLRFQQDFGSATLVPRSGNARAGSPLVWRVLVGSESSIDGAAALCARIRESGQEAFVVRIDDATPVGDLR